MTGRTHLTEGIAAGLLVAYFTGASIPLCLAAGALGGLVPDVDHPQSMLSGYIPGSGLILSLGQVRHRGFTHSFLFVALIFAAWFAASQTYTLPYPALVAFVAGVVTHIASDMLTPAGVMLLYPVRGNWKFAPGFVLHIAKFFGVVEFAVWLAAMALIFLSAGLLTGIVKP